MAVLEGALGRSLTGAEKASIAASATAREAAAKAALAGYKAKVAAALGLSVADLDAKVAAYIKANHGARGLAQGALISAALGITLTDAQSAALTAAASERDAALTAAIDAYRASVAATLSLSVADLDTKVAAYLKANPGANCPPGGGGSGTGGGTGSGGSST